MKKPKNQVEFGFGDAGEAVPAGPGEAPPPAAKPDARSPAHPSTPEGHGPLKTLMDFNFLHYASYVICDRAIPALEDGLKPVQRRILHSLHKNDDGRFIKVANVVGYCMQFHPHGDASITDALVNLANKDYLIEGQGNFGNLHTGDRAAAARYIECRLTELARNEIFNDDLTAFVPTYDGRNEEPVTLPCKLPLLLMLGADGIAVGLSTRILPHNFRELLNAQIAILTHRSFSIVPDFAQAGMMDVSEYGKGNGRILLRARIRPAVGHKLVISEIPFGTTTESLIASIEDAVRRKKVPVKSISDFTAETVAIELTLEPEAHADQAIKALYAFTDCESAITCHFTVIRGNRPVEMDVDAVLRENTRQLQELLKRELTIRKERLQEEIHAKTLAQIFIENRIYKRIEECGTYPAVLKAVSDGLEPFRDRLTRDVTQKDIEALLAIKIRQISLFDINRNKKDIGDLQVEVDKAEKSLANLVKFTIRYLKELLAKYGDRYPRRTEITTFETVAVRELTARELKLMYDRESGYVGHGVKGELLLECSSYDKLILAWKDGRYKVSEPPEKLFAGPDLIYAAVFDRDRTMTLVYTQDPFTFLKRFTFGGAILNKEYLCTPSDSSVLLLQEGTPDQVFFKYKQAKSQRIHQQRFRPADVPVKNVKARGNHLTAKGIDRIATSLPRWWQEDPKE